VSAVRDVLRLGVLGCAGIAERRMLPSMLHQPLVSIVAIASRDLARATSFTDRFGGVPVAGYDALLARDDVDAVYLPLPPALHVEWALRALDAGKHVLCEKPFAPSLADAERVVAAARERGLLVMESFMFLHHSQHAAVAKLLADGAIGEPCAFHSEFGVPMLPGDPPRHAGTLPEVAVYPIRAAQHILGDGLTVLGAHLRTDGERGLPTGGGALLVSPAGVTAHLTYGVEHGYRSGYAIWGSAGRLSLARAFTPPDDFSPVLRLSRPSGVQELTLEPDRPFVNIAGAFSRTILHGGDFARHRDDIVDHARLVDRIDSRAAGTTDR